VKPCTGTKWVTNPIRQRVATSRERVLRGREKERPMPLFGWDESRTRSVDSECVCRVIEPRNLTFRESLPFGLWGWQHWRAVWLGATESPGSESRARTHRVPQERERPCHHPPLTGWEPDHEEMRGPLGGRESEHPIVPLKRGNSAQGDPVEERGLSGNGARQRNDNWGHRTPGLSHRKLANSGPGEWGRGSPTSGNQLGHARQRVARRPILRSRMHELCTSGSVGGLGQQRQRWTRKGEL
jgi:hypothetical protein